MDCDVCTERFNAGLRRPKVLPCGHTFCLSCLQHENIGNRCPMDRKEFRGTPKSLPDNFKVIALLDSKADEVRVVSSVWWCQDCSLAASDGCLERKHAVVSLRRERTRRSAGDAEAVGRGERAATALAPLLEALYANPAAGLVAVPRRHADAVAKQLRVLKETRAALDAALEGDEAAWDTAARAAAAQARQVAPLEHALWLLGGAGGDADVGSCTITVTRGGRTATATLPLASPASPHPAPAAPSAAPEPPAAPASEQDAAVPLLEAAVEVIPETVGDRVEQSAHTGDPGQLLLQYLLLVLLDGNVLKVVSLTGENRGDSASLNLAEVSVRQRKCEEKAALLGSLEQVRRVVGLHCDVDPRWSLRLLRALPTSLQELELLGVGLLHLQALRALLPGLRRLRVEDLSTVAPCDRAVRVVSFPTASQRAGRPAPSLQHLRVLLRHKGTVESLLRASGSSLESLELGVGVPSRSSTWPSSCEDSDLRALLEHLDLEALQRLVLVRDSLIHGSPGNAACRSQLQTLARRLELRQFRSSSPATRPPESGPRGVPMSYRPLRSSPRNAGSIVLCSICHAEHLNQVSSDPVSAL